MRASISASRIAATTHSAASAHYCQAGMTPGKLGGMSPCPQRDQCALYQKYSADKCRPEGIERSMKIFTRPFIDGKPCHYFKPVA